MKNLKDIILEKLVINSKTKIAKTISPENIVGPETPGLDYFDEEVNIIGWPFKDKQDINYKKTKEYIRKNRYMINNDLEDIEDFEEYEYFVYANSEIEPNILNCYVYGEGGVRIKK